MARAHRIAWWSALIVVGCGLSERDRPTTFAPYQHDAAAPSAVTGTVVVGVGAGLVQAGGHGGDDGCLDVEVPCNGFDDDCDATTPDEPATDGDGDGFPLCMDCDDGAASVHPGAMEMCGDSVDQDCDGVDGICAECGNDIVEAGEVCDDNNTVGGDGCRADCLGIEVCGDGLVDPATEDCDPPQDGKCIGACAGCTCPEVWFFEEVTTAAGIAHQHSYMDEPGPPGRETLYVSGGVAAGDYDGDGWVDLYAVGGHLSTNTLWRNTGTGTFVDMATAAGVALSGIHGSGPVFADIDGDGGLDLFVGGLVNTDIRLFRNRMDGTFEDVTASSGLAGDDTNIGAAFGDYDRDGDLDMALSHWASNSATAPTHLWRNDGGNTFNAAGVSTGLDVALDLGMVDFTFAPTFTDYDADGWPDLLWSVDFGRSRVIHNDGGTFTNTTNAAISDENGMGSAVGDYDNDGDLDWFVTSIFDPDGMAEGNWGTSGNRLYQNQGDGTFTDVTAAAGVRVGYWGWGACFADFDNDGHLDIFHTNGFNDTSFTLDFQQDPSRLFVNNRDGTFTERSLELDLEHNGQGRGVSCFDYDRDGDIDIVVFDNDGGLHLYENSLPAGRHFLAITLGGNAPNTEAIGSHITLDIAGKIQTREIRVGSNYVSQDPALAHFGVDSATVVDTVTVRWPDQTQTVLTNVAVDQYLHVSQP